MAREKVANTGGITSVGPVDDETDQVDGSASRRSSEQAVGYRLVDGGKCLYGDAIQSGDLVRANFDKRHVHTGGGLFLVEEWRDGRLVWSGCRRMTRVPGGAIAMDDSGTGEWRTRESIAPLVVVATVEAVYRNTYRG